MARKPPKKGKGPARARKPERVTAPPPTAEPALPGVNPAIEPHDPPEDSAPFTIVGIGASAGGLEAITELLRELPTDTGMAFVVVQHLDPHHTSMLSEILSRATELPVAEITDLIRVEPDHVYVIPPGKDMVLGEGLLQLSPRTEQRGQHRPIDRFLRSLAEEQAYKSIGVILSGSANDGTQGLEEIKAAGGITFAQDNTAEHTSMPRSAIAAGCVDFVMPPKEIAAEIGRIARHPLVAPNRHRTATDEAAIRRILELLRHTAGVDFADYKRNTLHRRITRRMVLHKLDTLHDYVKFLQSSPGEPEALFQDILINVTSFFRNPDAYEALKTQVFPKLTDDKLKHEQLRVWTLGCSTGEEAYSIAMAYVEYAEASGQRIPMQIFATDLNGAGIERARAGIYPKGIAQDVSPERLRKFFVDVDGSYRVTKPIRDMCVFAKQNVLADPPFSRMDLVACRNLLIYLEPNLQQKLMPILHYALRDPGFLWLGSSETVGSFRDLFEATDARLKIYAKKPGAGRHPVPLAGRAPLVYAPPARAERRPELAQPAVDTQKEADRMLLARYAPAGVMVNADLEIIQFRGETGPYLAPAPGRASLSLLKMLREGLLVEVRSAVLKAQREDTTVRQNGLRVKSNGGYREVNVTVMPVRGAGVANGSLLVLFEEPRLTDRQQKVSDERDRAAGRLPKKAPPDAGGAREIARLKQELNSTREYLQSVIEQQEAANEELQSANEEVQSANEELQSINEELETSKEEIQSSNEELATVNDELHNRNNELSQSNSDLVNLLSSVQMAIVMLGRDLRIRRFTPMAERLMNLIPADIGRPIGDIKLTLDVANFDELLLEVIDTVSSREQEVRDKSGRQYVMRLRPYKTLENKIDGVVMVLVDIDALKRSQDVLRVQSELLEQTQEPIMAWERDGTITYWNRGAEETYGYSKERALGRNIHELLATNVPPTVFKEALDKHGHWTGELVHLAQDGQKIFVESRMALIDDSGGHQRVIETARPITERMLREDALRRRAEDLASADRSKNEFLAVLAHELRNPLAALRSASDVMGESHAKPQAVKQAMAVIDQQTQQMKRMVDDLLDIARISHGTIQLARQPLDLAQLIRDSVVATEHQRTLNQQQLSVSLPSRPLRVMGDPMRLQQVVGNLLTNSSKFTPNGGKISIVAETGADDGSDQPKWAVIRVRDEGEGIQPEMLPKVFDMFTRAEGLPERGRPGLGIGLSLARRLAELHGGTIEARSEGPHRGSEFVVRLPLTELPLPEAAETPAASEATKPRRVLIIDDNVDAVRMMQILLETSGHTVRVAHDGKNAIEEAAAFVPEVVLLDIGLPGTDGYRIIADLRDEPALSHTRFVAVTGYGREEDIRRSQQAGFDEHLTKPVEPAALRRAVAAPPPRPRARDEDDPPTRPKSGKRRTS